MCLDQEARWRGGDSNSRPRAYESPALPLSYLAAPKTIAHSKGTMADGMPLRSGDQEPWNPLSWNCSRSTSRGVRPTRRELDRAHTVEKYLWSRSQGAFRDPEQGLAKPLTFNSRRDRASCHSALRLQIQSEEYQIVMMTTHFGLSTVRGDGVESTGPSPTSNSRSRGVRLSRARFLGMDEVKGSIDFRPINAITREPFGALFFEWVRSRD